MAGIRVHELAKEFGMTSKELLVRLAELKIPAKGHSSTLVDAYVDKIRKQLGPEIAEMQIKAEEEKKAEAAAKAAAERKRREEEAAARAAAAEKERALREAERAKQEHKTESTESLDEPATKSPGVAGKAAAPPSGKPGVSSSAADKTQDDTAIDEPIKQEPGTDDAAHAADVADAADAVTKEAPSKTDPSKKKEPTFSGLLSQIEAEQSRIQAELARLKEEKSRKAAERAQKKESKPGKVASAIKDDLAPAGEVEQEKSEKPVGRQKIAKETSTIEAETESEGRAGRKGKGRRDHGAGQHAEGTGRGRKGKDSRKQHDRQIADSYDSDDTAEGDRYKQMAVAAEMLQREKVLADARAAVKAADDEGGGRRKRRKEKREAEAKERAELVAIERGLDPELVLDSSVAEIPTGATVQEFSDIVGATSGDVVKRLFLLGSPLTVTQTMSNDLIELIADDLERKIRIVSPEEEYAINIVDTPESLEPRPPVVTVMGHVDHGKTSLLDAIRETKVITTEAGGITQHIGASVAHINGQQITFIDTPGHEAFTAMRARGAKVTDVVVLVVAADDGVMPQTVEAINHADAAGVPIVVAVNKIDKPGANPDRARQELSEHGIVPEEWGGRNMFVEVSAKKRTNIEELLEAIILQADVLELKANPNALATGFVIEAKLDKGRGPVATVLVQRGTLNVGDTIVMGTSYGRVRALINPLGETGSEAKPSDPVEIIGLNSIPAAGDDFRVFAEEREARNLVKDRSLRQRVAEHQNKSRVTLENFFSRIEQNEISDLNLIVKADVQGSIEALSDALDKMDQTEVRINIIHSAVGGVTETDVTLATASNAIIIGFNVRPTVKAKQMADREEVEIKTYKIIYQAIEDIDAARVGLLSPDIVEKDTGMAEVRETFKVPKMGTIAGCLVEEGEIGRDDEIRVIRNGMVIHEGVIASLKRFKEDAKSVKAGYECGIGIDGYQDVKVGDVLETFKKTEIVREA
ncbi:MAG: translation initiation factor IF-2 [Coriobacteriia bacterium]|nr:translation initiation factor IF-2 [Coriobacteriia bacterium]